MIHADYLFLLTDVDGLYTENPRKNPNAKKIETVDSISDVRAQGTLRSNPEVRWAKHVQLAPRHWAPISERGEWRQN
jgi:uridylate kinase